MRYAVLVVFIFILTSTIHAQTEVVNGQRYERLVIRNAIVADGNGTPARGPFDIVLENNRIAALVPLDPVAVKNGSANRPAGDAEIDATGKYVLPGLINAHAHVQDSRGGIPQPLDYELSLWLACGITTVRDVGSNVDNYPVAAAPDRQARHFAYRCR